MAPLTNTNLQLLNQFKNLSYGIGIGESSFLQKFGNVNLGSNLNLGNILAGINDIENIGSDSAQQQMAGVQNLISRALDIITKLSGNGETQSAKRDAERDSKSTKKIDNDANQLNTDLNNTFTQISGEINNESEIVQSAISDIEKANEKLEEEQEKIEQIVADMQALQQELSITTDPNEQKEILNSIQGLAGQLAVSTETIVNLQEIVTCASQEVQSSYEAMQSLSGNAEAAQQEGETEIGKISQEASEQAQNNTKTKVKSQENKLTSEAAAAAAAKASSNIFTGTSIAPKLYRVEVDQNNASIIREMSSAMNLNTLLQGILKMNDSITALEGFNTSIGSALQDYSGYIGDWNTKLEPMITSFGTLMDNGGVNKIVEDVNNAVTSDLQTIGETNNDTTTKQQDNDRDNRLKIWQSNQQTGTEKQQLNNLQTPKVQIKFGI